MYRCIEGFVVDKFDDDGFHTDAQIIVDKGSLWYEDGNRSVIGGEVHLRDKGGLWLELSKERLENYFEVIE